MPGKVKVRILAGRNLPVMDRSSDTTDAYVEVKIGNTTYKTDVYRKSLNPQWNSEWFIFEVDDLELQDEPLQIRLMDHDTYSSDDAIGKVYIDLNPLLFVPAMSSAPKSSNDSSNAAGTMTGWLPVFDTMHGIRGEVNVLVKVDLFSDFNKFRQSSCGVQFFFTSEIPAGFKCNSIIGFAEELVINDDPEYQWIDKIRTPRASNEARQTLFSKLSGELQRRIGLKVQDQGGNAVLGYRQCFDLEGESGIVVRGIGSIVSLAKIPVDGASVPLGPSSISPCRDGSSFEGQKDLVDPTSERSSLFTVSPKRMSRSRKTSGGCTSRSPQMTEGGTENAFRSQSPTNGGLTTSPTQNSGHNRRSSESDISITPKGNCVHGGACPGGKHCTHGVCKNGVKSMTLHESFDNIIYPFLTMKKFPPDFIVHLGGTVSARSVKILDRNYVPDEMDSRDSWWSQIRTEIRSHARSIACNVVLGYEEFTTICDDICILNATGTAAVINICSLDNEGGCAKPPRDTLLSTSLERKEEAANVKNLTKESQVYLRHKASSPRPLRRLIQQNALCRSHPNVVEEMSDPTIQMSKTEVNKSVQTSSVPRPQTSCSLCHIPYDEKANPFNMKISKCGVCKSGKVPDILLTTLEIPTSIPVTGRGCFIQARVVRAKKDLKGELNAKEISDSLPFLEYELHKQLYHKIMVKGMNALFGLRVRVTIGEKIVVGVGTGTAVFLTSLPPPPLPKVTIAGTGPEEEAKRMEVQRRLQSVFEKNKEMYGLKDTASDLRPSVESKSSDTDDSDDDRLDFDLSCGNKGAFVLDLDDTEDVEMLSLLTEETKPCNFITAVTTQTPPGFSVDQSTVNLQMFTKIWISKVPPHIPRPLFSSYFETLMKSICFKVRNLTPCVLSGLKVDVALPEPDELQICILGMIMGQGLPSFQKKNSSDASKIYKTEELIPELKRKKIDESDLMFPMEEVKGVEDRTNSIQELNEAVNGMNMNGSSSGKNSVQMCSSASFAQSVPSVSSTASFSSSSSSGRSVNKGFERHQGHRQILSGTDQFGIDITPLSFIPGTKILRYLSNLNFFFIRESTSLKENGGLSGFLGSFVTEVLALVRAHVAALGGNALISYFLNECILFHNPHKNQAQCLINVGGDIVQVSYPNLSSNLRYRPDSCNHIPSSTQESAGE